MRALLIQLLAIFIAIMPNIECVSQTKIDDHNVNYLVFYLPLFKDSKTKEIKKTELDSIGKIVAVEISMFDTNGYLKSVKNIDFANFFGDSELILIEKKKYDNFLITRKISQLSLLKAPNIPNSFWGWYDSISKIPILKDSQFIQVKSLYKWRQDSSFSFETSANGIIIGRGNIETLIIRDNKEYPVEKDKIDTTYLGDTAIIKIIAHPFGSRFIIDNKFLVDNRLVKSTYNITDRKFEEFGTTLYGYNHTGQKTLETYYGRGNRFRGKKEFIYSSKTDLIPHEERHYDYNTEVTSITTYDKTVRIVEKFEKRVFANENFKLVMQKIIEEYKGDNLMRRRIFFDNQLYWTTLYEYDFYQ